MAKGVYIGVGGTVKKSNKIYLGVSGAVKRVKKGYLGVGGAIKLIYSAEPSLSTSFARDILVCNSSGCNIGDYALFAGGYTNYTTYTKTNVVTAYSSSLVRVNPANISGLTASLASGKNSKYAIYGNGTDCINYLDAYDVSLNHTAIYNPLGAISSSGCATVGDRVMFYGGKDSTNNALQGGMAYNANLVGTQVYTSEQWYRCFGVTFPSYAVFATDNGGASMMIAFDSSLGYHSITTNPNMQCYFGTAIGNYALLGGITWNPMWQRSSQLDIYDNSLVRTGATNMSSIRGDVAACSTPTHAVFAGGVDSNSVSSNIVDLFDVSLVRSSTTMSRARYGCDITNINDKVFIADGLVYSSTPQQTWTIQQVVDILQ